MTQASKDWKPANEKADTSDENFNSSGCFKLESSSAEHPVSDNQTANDPEATAGNTNQAYTEGVEHF